MAECRIFSGVIEVGVYLGDMGKKWAG